MRVDRGLRVVWAALSGAVALSVLSAAESPPNSVSSLAQRARDSLAVISHMGRDGKEQGVGAGFVISRDGLIATALHVIGEGRPIAVRLANGERFEASEIHAWDRTLDLAIIRVPATNLKPLALGDSSKLEQGASVVALGNPLGLEHSVVEGVVSARREFDGLELIQLAIPIEPGNSGGPLLDMHGKVQGVLTMKSAMTRNLGFAVPVNPLRALREKPNPVPMTRWLRLGSLNQREWEPLMGATWRQQNGQVVVDGFGQGFGGRSLCLSRQSVPSVPYELGVWVKLDDESGAAGLVFDSDGGDHHYGFYPTAGQLRLTRFEGPSVFSWTILETVPSEEYRPGEWNHLKVRVEAGKLLCFVNEHLVIESTDRELKKGRAGLAKFRDTKSAFKGFEIGPRVAAVRGDSESLEEQARKLEREAVRLRLSAAMAHRESVRKALTDLFQAPESRIDLFHATLLLSKLDNPDLDVAFYQRQFRGMVEELAAGMPNDPKAKLARLKQYFFEDNGFHGSRTDYYDPANSYMDDVLDDREGLPITLTVLFMELARGAGLDGVSGVSAPGHFVARFTPPADGEPVDLDIYDGGTETPASRLKPASKKEIVIRMLRNLMNARARESSMTLHYLDLILALDPASAADRFARAMVHYRNGNNEAAKEDFKVLLEEDLPDLEREKLMDLYRKL